MKMLHENISLLTLPAYKTEQNSREIRLHELQEDSKISLFS